MSPIPSSLIGIQTTPVVAVHTELADGMLRVWTGPDRSAALLIIRPEPQLQLLARILADRLAVPSAAPFATRVSQIVEELAP